MKNGNKSLISNGNENQIRKWISNLKMKMRMKNHSKIGQKIGQKVHKDLRNGGFKKMKIQLENVNENSIWK